MLKTNTVIAAQECHPPLIYVTLSKLTEMENILLWAPPADPGYAPQRTTSTALLCVQTSYCTNMFASREHEF